MKARWKLLGLAGAAGVAATGAIAARNRRPQSDYSPDELRDRLRERLEQVQAGNEEAAPVVPAQGLSVEGGSDRRSNARPRPRE